VAQATLDAVVPSGTGSSPSPTSQNASSARAGVAAHTADLRSMPARAQPSSAAGASYREQLEAQPPHSAGAAGAGDAAGLHEHHSIFPAASAAQGPESAPQHEQGVPRTVSSVFHTPPAVRGAPPTMQSEQKSASVPGSGPGLAQAQPSPFLQPAQGEAAYTPAASAAASLSGIQPSADALVAYTADSSQSPAVPATAGPQVAAMVAAMDAEVDDPDALTDELVDDDLPELPEGYSYLGRRMVRATLRVRVRANVGVGCEVGFRVGIRGSPLLRSVSML